MEKIASRIRIGARFLARSARHSPILAAGLQIAPPGL
jgi:hypothetical protein